MGTHKGGREQRIEELKAKIRQNYKIHRAYNVGCKWKDCYPQTPGQIGAGVAGNRLMYVGKQNRIILHRISMNNLGKRKEENELYQRLNDKQTQGCYIK